MTTDPPPGAEPFGPDEIRLADFLDEAFALYARGALVRPAELLADSPALVGAGERLLADARDLFGAAVGLRGWSSLLHSAALEPPALPAGPAPADPFPGAFRLLRRLGQGAFGGVWLAEDLHLKREVALKMILPAGPPAEGDRRLDRLRDEARLLAAVRHPNVVPVLAWQEGRDESGARVAAVVMRYVAGGSLADRVRREGPLHWATAVRYLADVAVGLRAVHAAGLVHRDIKPANILWDADSDEALLTDFGLAARLAEAAGRAGTPFYMPPEALEGRVGPDQDVYGLAASLFWLVTGWVPFPAADLTHLAKHVRRGLPDPDPRCVDLPRPVERLIRAGLAAEPSGRPSLDDFAARLRGALNHLLADTLPASGVRPASPLRLTVSRQAGGQTFVPVATSRPGPERLVRDLRRVPREPDRVDLRTGERVRLEVEADRPGYVTVFNVGPTGNLNLLYPDNPAAPAAVAPGRPLHVLDVALTPPAGTERLFALWSREPLPLRLEELASLAAGAGLPAAGPYRATRDMKRLQESVRELPAEAWDAAVVELNHLPLEDAP
jgi:serine/threonine-protein kinase